MTPRFIADEIFVYMTGLPTTRKPDFPEQDEERLLKLFRNRTELKKEFADLRREGDKMKEKLLEQENAMLRSKQQLEQLEGMLSEPVQAANASVFYQLRGLWSHGCKMLARLAVELQDMQRNRQMKLDVDQFVASRNASLNIILRDLRGAKQRLDKASEKLTESQQRHIRARGFWNYFVRRNIAIEIDAALDEVRFARLDFETCMQKKRVKEEEEGPQFDGFSIAGRRRINLTLIAIAQYLYLHFNKGNYASLARETSVRHVSEASYGDIEKCREINEHIERKLRKLPAGQSLISRVRNRVIWLEKHASYRRDTDTVPVAGSFSQIPIEIDQEGDVVSQQSVGTNVLADEYWEIYAALLN